MWHKLVAVEVSMKPTLSEVASAADETAGFVISFMSVEAGDEDDDTGVHAFTLLKRAPFS